MDFNAMQCDAIQCNILEYIAMQLNLLQWEAT